MTTPSTDTGPEKAATGIYYIYTEASYPRTFGDKAVLTTEATTLQGRLLLNIYRGFALSVNVNRTVMLRGTEG